MPEYTLRANNGAIHTDIYGYLSLLNFYNYARTVRNCWITLNLDGINFIDANLTALLLAMINSLEKTNKLRVFTDFKSLKGDLHILFRNGFISHIGKKEFEFKPYDSRDTTVPLKYFNCNDADGFVSYIENNLIIQRGLVKVKFTDKETVKTSYFEIFDNVGIHANTTEPIYMCGQYFPKLQELKVTLVDLGEGFLTKITEFTKDSDKITQPADAIRWAINGGSTKKDAKGGTGLKKIFWFCKKSGGSIHIITDGCYWNFTNNGLSTQRLSNPFVGTTIHLIFRYLSI
jgi:hypothetical protein